MLRGLVLSVAVLLCAVACGGSHSATKTTSKTCRDTKALLAKIQGDIVALRKAAALPTRSTLDGNHAINVATDAFEHDIDTAPISNLQRNRLIDHAAGAISTRCQQCFQALEADRPIPSIAHGDTGCG